MQDYMTVFIRHSFDPSEFKIVTEWLVVSTVPYRMPAEIKSGASFDTPRDY